MLKLVMRTFSLEQRNVHIISAEYSLGGNAIGKIGFIGPRRINYSKVIAIMAQVMKELNKSITNQRIE